MSKKIIILNGSPRKNGNTSSLVKAFTDGAKEAGKWRLEGKDYIVQDGDVMHFRFNV